MNVRLKMLSQAGSNEKMATYFEAVTSRNPMKVPDAPYKYVEFFRLPIDKQMANYQKFMEISDIREFVDIKWKSELYNKESIIMLAQLRQECEPHLKHAVEFKIRQFIDYLQDQKTVYTALKVNYMTLGIHDLTKPVEDKVIWDDENNQG